MTGLGLIQSALRLIMAIAPGESITAAEAADALCTLNDLLDAWTADRTLVFTIPRQVFTLTAGQQAYTLGAGGDFDYPRPAKIDRVGIIPSSNPAQPPELPIDYLTDQQWANVPVKNVTSVLPSKVWDDGGFPLRTLTFWPLPSVAVQAAIYLWQQLTQFANLATSVTFPPAYARALRYNLAIDLAPEYGKSVPPEVASGAASSLLAIKTLNTNMPELRCQTPFGEAVGQYNWMTDQPVRS